MELQGISFNFPPVTLAWTQPPAILSFLKFVNCLESNSKTPSMRLFPHFSSQTGKLICVHHFPIGKCSPRYVTIVSSFQVSLRLIAYSLDQILRIVLWGQTALTHTATCRPGAKSNGTRWNMNACTPGYLAWAAVIVCEACFESCIIHFH